MQSCNRCGALSPAKERHTDNTRVYQKTGTGILPVDIIREENEYLILMTQREAITRTGAMEVFVTIESRKPVLERISGIDTIAVSTELWFSNLSISRKPSGNFKVV